MIHHTVRGTRCPAPAGWYPLFPQVPSEDQSLSLNHCYSPLYVDQENGIGGRSALVKSENLEAGRGPAAAVFQDREPVIVENTSSAVGKFSLVQTQQEGNVVYLVQVESDKPPEEAQGSGNPPVINRFSSSNSAFQTRPFFVLGRLVQTHGRDSRLDSAASFARGCHAVGQGVCSGSAGFHFRASQQAEPLEAFGRQQAAQRGGGNRREVHHFPHGPAGSPQEETRPQRGRQGFKLGIDGRAAEEKGGESEQGEFAS